MLNGAQIDIYCERVDFSLWSEPVNALTNLAFIALAVVMWHRAEGVPAARMLAAMLFAIGCLSGLFHVLATSWAAALDVLSIQIFSLSYIYLANRDYLGFGPVIAGAATLVYFPYSYAISGLARSLVPGLGGTVDYVPLPLLIAAYGLYLLGPAPATGRGLLIGAGVLVVSMAARTVDLPFCDSWPLGTHFLWHVLNAVMLAWMIEVYLRHVGSE